jgi:hypothetical protein
VQERLEEAAGDFFGLPSHFGTFHSQLRCFLIGALGAREAAWQVATGDSLRRAEAEAAMTKLARPNALGEGEKALQLSEQFLVLITCRDEKQQVELLGRFQGEGLECKALMG